MIGICDEDGAFPIPGMSIKICTNQLAIFLPSVQRVGGRVDAAESFAVAHESQQIGLLSIAQFQLAAGEEVKHVEIAQRVGGDERQILTANYFKGSRTGA